MSDAEQASPAEATPRSPDSEAEAVAGALDDAPFGGDDGHRRLLLVSLPGGVVALPAEAIVEVLPARRYARVPGAPDAVAGLANRRGRMLTVVDLGAALGGLAASDDTEHRVVVVAFGGRELGLAVSDVLQITADWWTGESEGAEGEPAGALSAGVPDAPGGDDQRLRVVELHSVFKPLFGGNQDVGEPTMERS